MIIEFICAHWADVLLSLISAGLLAFCRYLWKEMSKYKSLLEEKDQQEIQKIIDERTEPIKQEIRELYEKIMELELKIDKTSETFQNQIKIILTSYKYRLVALCKIYLEHKSISPDELEQLTEMYKVYSDLGGNGEAEKYYNRTIQLPIRA